MIRPKCVSNFTQIPNLLIRCKSLSTTARMLLIAAISTPDGWKFSEEGMQTAFGFKRAELRNSIKELIEAKILSRKPVLNERKLIRGYDWIFNFDFISDGKCDISSFPSAQPSHGEPSHGEPSHGEPSHGEPSHGEPYNGEPCHGKPNYGEPHDGDYTIQTKKDRENNTKRRDTLSTNRQSVVKAPTQEQLEKVYQEFGDNQECVDKMREIATVCKQTNWQGIGHPIEYIRGVGVKVKEDWDGFVARCDASELMRREYA